MDICLKIQNYFNKAYGHFNFCFGIILCLTGIVGSFLPVIPGPITSWTGILILNLTMLYHLILKFVLITCQLQF